MDISSKLPFIDIEICHNLRDGSCVMVRGGSETEVVVVPLRKWGAEKVLALLKGGGGGT